MSASESSTERESPDSSPTEGNRPSLADFLAPPRARISAPPPVREAAAPDAPADSEMTAAPDAPPAQVDAATSLEAALLEATEASASSAEATTPTEPTAVSDAPPAVSDAPAPAAPVAAVGAAAPVESVAPPPISDAAARSLIPVATSDSDTPQDEADDFDLPGAGSRWSGAAVRRVTFVALLAAAAAVPAWVVFRARSVEIPRIDAAKVTAASAGPSTLPAREIEADENETAPAEPIVAAVPVDPVKALESRREARRLLEAGQIEPGVAAARNAIALNPADPESYVLLAAGLQDMGRWAESREVFSRCIHKSKDGINAECAYFASSGTLTNR